MIDPKELEAVRKKVKEAKKPPTMFTLRLELGYNRKLVLPYEAGMAIIDALAKAEIIKGTYADDVPEIKAATSDEVTIEFFSPSTYEYMKMAELLKVTNKEMHAALYPTTTT